MVKDIVKDIVEVPEKTKPFETAGGIPSAYSLRGKNSGSPNRLNHTGPLASQVPAYLGSPRRSPIKSKTLGSPAGQPFVAYSPPRNGHYYT